jgi:hypothetical protein
VKLGGRRTGTRRGICWGDIVCWQANVPAAAQGKVGKVGEVRPHALRHWPTRDVCHSCHSRLRWAWVGDWDSAYTHTTSHTVPRAISALDQKPPTRAQAILLNCAAAARRPALLSSKISHASRLGASFLFVLRRRSNSKLSPLVTGPPNEATFLLNIPCIVIS